MVLLNFKKETSHIPTVTRYNGGWLKTVTGLDKTVTNGFSIEGEFVQAGDFKMDYKPGLYVDCSKGGSRKNQKWNYHLFQVNDKGFHLLQTVEDGRGAWACEFWEMIEQELPNECKPSAMEIARMTYELAEDRETLMEVIERLSLKAQSMNTE